MLLFEHKQYLQSYDAESSMQMEISSFKILAVSNKLLPGFVTSQTQINPVLGNMQRRGRGHVALF